MEIKLKTNDDAYYYLKDGEAPIDELNLSEVRELEKEYGHLQFKSGTKRPGGGYNVTVIVEGWDGALEVGDYTARFRVLSFNKAFICALFEGNPYYEGECDVIYIGGVATAVTPNRLTFPLSGPGVEYYTNKRFL